MTFAINVDPDNSDQYAHQSPATLFSEKFRGVRFTSRNTDANRNYVVSCHSSGLRVLAIVTGESKGYLVPGADVYQIGNEPDAAGSSITADDYYWNWWKVYRDTYPTLTMYMAGLVSGDPHSTAYAKRVLDLCTANGTRLPDAIDIHPYTKDSRGALHELTTMTTMLTLNSWSIPLSVTEWHQTAASGDMWNYACNLNAGLASLWNSFFCYTDAMVPPFGLRAASGVPKDDYNSLLSCPCIP